MIKSLLEISLPIHIPNKFPNFRHPIRPHRLGKKWIPETTYTTLSLDLCPSRARAIRDKLPFRLLPILSKHLRTAYSQV